MLDLGHAERIFQSTWTIGQFFLANGDKLQMKYFVMCFAVIMLATDGGLENNVDLRAHNLQWYG